MINPNDISGYSGICCFCKQKIKVTEIDPCNLGLVGHWDRENENRPSIDFFCHLSCIKLLLHQQCAESRKHEITKHEFVCCFCNNIIEKNEINPCHIDIVACLDKPKNQQFRQAYCFHLDCLKIRVHEYFMGYLIDGIFSIKDN